MWTLISITVVFLLLSAGVAALARSTTARWEMERKAIRARRREATAPDPARTRVAVRWGRALAGGVQKTRSAAAHVRVRLSAPVLTPATSRQRVAGVVRHVPQAWDALRRGGRGHRSPDAPELVPQQEDPQGDVSVAETPPRRAHIVRRRLAAVVRRRRHPSSPVPRLAHQLAGWGARRQGRRRTSPESDEHSGPSA
jgi:hypothetical protein